MHAVDRRARAAAAPGRPIVSKLVIDGVGRTFPGVNGGAPTLALTPISFDVADNDFITILGPSGCGKSTLLRIVAGLDRPTAGRVCLDGADVSGPGADRGMVFQSYTLFPWLTVEENVRFGLREKRMPAAEQADVARHWIHKVGLDGFARHYPKMLSGGMQQRTALARALANDPRMLLMDEPFGAVDPINRESIQNEFFEMQRKLGMTVIMVSHDIDEAIKLGDKVAVFKSGRLLQYDHPDTLLAHPADEFVSAFTGQDSTLKRLLLVRAEDAADSSLVTARPQTPVAEALELMDENDRRYLIVVDDQGKGLGYVRRKDLRRQEGTCAPFVTPFRVTASHDEHLRILLSRMYEFNSSWLPVLDPDQQFLGEVTQESIADYLSSGRSRGGKGLIVSPAEQVGA